MQMTKKPRIYVVVLNWNNYADTQKCLESLRTATYSNLRIIVVDNGSIDGSGQRLAREYPEWPVILNDSNLGFSRGCNVGIRAALEDETCAYVLLLNNDATATPSFLEKAVEAAEADRRVG